MDSFAQGSYRNSLLSQFSPSTLAMLAPNMTRKELSAGHQLNSPHREPRHVCFLESGLAVVTGSNAAGQTIVVGNVGHEGMTPHWIILGIARSSLYSLMLSKGSGLIIPVQAFRRALAADPQLQTLMMRYVYCCEQQFVHSALSNGRYDIHQRLARWLLICQDRLGDDLDLTHNSIAMMLGVRRSGITDHLHLLEGEGAVKSTRGRIRIVDRTKLLHIADGCYGSPEQEYERLIYEHA